jgi:2-dehydro-3-deoxyphosphogluconate aldolase/(4S)-4-hydroxy-2-oxoglutarate aldolase
MHAEQFQSQIDFIKQQTLIPVFNHTKVKTCMHVIETCYLANIRIFEFTNRDSKALDVFKELRKEVTSNFPGLQLGAGTIFNLKTAEEFMDAGATFIVSPAFVPSMRGVQTTNSTLWIPGCATISELAQAQEIGVKMMKIFPGELLGPQFVKAALSVMPNLNLMPTGGVEPTEENLSAWLNSGVTAIGIGSKLFDKQLIENEEWNELKNRLINAKALIEKLKLHKP